MKISIKLSNSGGVIAEDTVTVDHLDDDADEKANLAIHDAIEPWILSPGDTIRITEED